MDYAVEMTDIVQVFSGKKVLNGINLKVEKGEIMGLLGPSGAGKTTLVKIVTGQLCQTAGCAKLLGRNTGEMSGEVYQKIGVMMDNCGLYERLSVADNLKMFAKIYRVPMRRIDEVLERTGLMEARKRAVDKLSKGMRGRLSLARAVLNEAEVLFLDEPTSGLDPSTAREIHALLLEEQKKGTAIFLTTHNMAEAESICNHVALLNGGELVEYGAPKQICKNYNRLHKLQIELKDGRHLELEHTKASADTVRELLAKEEIATIHSTEPDLESVFMELTGRGFGE